MHFGFSKRILLILLQGWVRKKAGQPKYILFFLFFTFFLAGATI
jgi:hypothetical protein